MGRGISNLVSLKWYTLIALCPILFLPLPLAAQLDHFDFDPVATDTAGSPIPLTIYAKKASGDIDSSFTGTCTLDDSTHSISPTITGNFTNGTWSGTVTITVANQSDVITAGSGLASGSSNSFHVYPAALEHFDFSPITGTKTAGVPFPVTITARDQYENQVISFGGTVTLTDLTGSLAPGSVLFSGGQWSDSLTVTVATGSDYVTASYPGGITGTSGTFAVDNNVLDHFTFSAIGPTQTAGVPFSVTIQARDAYENLVDDFGSIVTLDDVTHDLSPTSADFDAGQWTGNLTVTEAIALDYITATYNSVSDTSNTFAVDNNVLDHFDFSTISSPQTAGEAFRDTLWARDAYGNLVDDFGSIVNLADQTGSLNPTTADFSGGVWSGNLTVTVAIASDTLRATYNSISSKSNSFEVVHNNLESFEFDSIGTQVAGVAFSITITAVDQYGNTVESFTGTVDLSDLTTTIEPSVSGNFMSGQWTGYVTISDTYDNDRIQAIGAGRLGYSNFFNVLAAEVDHFEFAQITGTKTAGVAFQITISAVDAIGNLVESYTGYASLRDSTGTLSPDMTGNFTNGQWSGSVSITQAITGDWIRAHDTVNDIEGISNTFTVSSAGLHHFTFNPIGNKIAGTPFSITIQARDQYENIVQSFTSSATLTDSTDTIDPETTGNFEAGVKTLSVRVTQALVGEWIEASYNSAAGKSNSFTVSPGVLDRFEFDTISDQTAGTYFPITIRAYDAYGNLKTDFTSSATLTDFTQSIQPTSTGPFSAGVWSGNVRIRLTYSGDRIFATASGKTSYSNPFDVLPGAVDHFIFANVPSQVIAGASFSPTITAKDSIENTVTTFNDSIWVYDISGTFSDTVQMSAGVWSGPVSVTLAMDDDRLTAQYGGVQSQSSFFDVKAANPEYLVLDPPGPLSVTVGAPQIFTATVTDLYGNRVPQANATFLLTGYADGSLDDNPDDPNDTAGSSTIQTGNTNDDGILTVLYTAPVEANRVDTLDAMSSPRIPQTEVVDVVITSADSGATRLVIIPQDPQEIRVEAGQIFTVRVEAQDGFGNVDSDDTTLVEIRSGSGDMEFSRDGFQTVLEEPWRLSAGSDTLWARSCTAAQNDTVSVSDVDGEGTLLAPCSKSQVYIEPAPPFGAITLSAGQDTLTADGNSTTTVTSQAIIDSCGNTVGSGSLITVAASLGTIVAADQEPGYPGVQVATNAAGEIEFSVRSSEVVGVSTVLATSREGEASGAIQIVFQAPPALAAVPGSLTPNTVAPGDSVSFQVEVSNMGGAGVTLDAGASVEFTDGTNTYRSYLATPVFIEGLSDTAALVFGKEQVPGEMAVASYTPRLVLSGTDTNGSPYGATVFLDPNALQISTMSIIRVYTPLDEVAVEDSFDVTIFIENNGDQSISLEDYGLDFNPPGSFSQVRTLPVSLPPHLTSSLTVGVKVNSLTTPGTYEIDAHAYGTSAGGEISDDAADTTDTIVVVSLATAEYVPGSLTPGTLSPAGEYALRVRVKNTGESSVNLSAGSTKISFGEEPESYEAFLASGTQMAGGGAITELVFSEKMLSPDFATGEYPLAIFLSGSTLGGGDFEQLLAAVDTVVVQSAPVMGYVEGSLSQERISRGFPLTLSLALTNAGGATLVLDPAKTSVVVTDGEATFKTPLNGSIVDEVSPGDTSLTFQTTTFPSNFRTGEYVPLLLLQGQYNGIALYDTTALDQVLVQVPATLRVNAQRSDTVVTIGQEFVVVAIVENRGEAGVQDEGTLLLDLSGTGFTVDEPVQSFGPSLPDTASWTVRVPDTSPTGIFDIAVEIETIPHDENTDPPEPALLYQGGIDEISVSVVEGNDLVVSMLDILGIPPRNVNAGQSGIPILALELANRGNAKSELQLDSLRVSIRERNGQVISPASTTIAGLSVSEDIGGSSVITQAGDLSAQTILLDFSSQDVRLSTTAPDTLYFSISVGASPGTETVLLHLAGSEHIHATDSLSQRQAAVVDPLGAPLGSLSSDFLVVNDDDFKTSFKNFPNPFRAGSENTTFSYYLPRNAGLELLIYTLTGELVRKFHFDPGSAGGSGPGMNSFVWDGRNGNGHVVLNGVYMCVVTANLEGSGSLSLKHKVAVMK